MNNNIKISPREFQINLSENTEVSTELAKEALDTFKATQRIESDRYLKELIINQSFGFLLGSLVCLGLFTVSFTIVSTVNQSTEVQR